MAWHGEIATWHKTVVATLFGISIVWAVGEWKADAEDAHQKAAEAQEIAEDLAEAASENADKWEILCLQEPTDPNIALICEYLEKDE